MSDVTPAVTVNLGDGFSVTSNEGDEASIKANFESEEKKPDDPEADPEKESKEKTSKAASELGKLGGKAAAEAKAKADKEPKEAKPAEKEKEPEPKAKADEDDDSEAQETRRNARIERLARERSEARAEAAEAKRRLAEREAADAAARAPQGDGRPQRAQFQSDEDYAEALAEHRVQGMLREFAELQQTEAEAKRLAEIKIAFKKQVDDELVKSLDPRIGHAEPAFVVAEKAMKARQPLKLEPENIIAEEFVLSTMAKEVGLHLSKHPEELDELMGNRNYRDHVRFFAKLEERLKPKPEKASEPAKETESKAPRPPRSIPAGAGDVEEDVDSDDVPFERFAAVHNSRLRRARNGR